MYKYIFILLLLFTSSAFSKTIITVTHPFEKYFIDKIADDKISVKVVFDKSSDYSVLYLLFFA